MKKNKFILVMILCLIVPLCLIFQGCGEFTSTISFTAKPNVQLKITLYKSDATSEVVFDNTVGNVLISPHGSVNEFPTSSNITFFGYYTQDFDEMEIEAHSPSDNGYIRIISVSDSDTKMYVSSGSQFPTTETYQITSTKDIVITFEDFGEVRTNLENASLDLDYADTNFYQGGGYYYHKNSLELKIVPDDGYQLPNTIEVIINSKVLEENYTFINGILTIDTSILNDLAFVEININAIANT